jgi:putrescine transport system substrate-binding protein
MLRSARRSAALAASVAALGALVCALRTAPAAERVVNFFNWSDYIDPAVLADFTASTQIRVQYDTFDSNDILETKLLAGKSGYDVVVPSAYFLQRQIKAGVFQKLDKSKLPNLVNAWDKISRRLAVYDPGNEYSINYMWGTVGIGYNVAKAKAALGGRQIDSWDVLFKPEQIAKFKDCGVHILDAPDDVLAAALHDLGLNPNTTQQADLEKAADLLMKVRPYVRKFHSSEYLNALATGEICFAVGFSGDIKQAQTRAAQAKNGIEIGYSIPKEGAQLWFDTLAVPKDAPHPQEALELINYLIRPDVAAKNTNFISYANGDTPTDAIDKSLRDDKTVYPDAGTMAKLYTMIAHDAKTQRLINRLWTKVKTGE